MHWLSSLPHLWNHLRMCGEYELALFATVFGGESPPHARRIPLDTAKLTTIERISGEYIWKQLKMTARLGSPPHVRRILDVETVNDSSIRITSACAENTHTSQLKLVQYWDHLRMCGEYRPWTNLLPKPSGSPPHVRRIHLIDLLLVMVSLGSPPHVRRIQLAR